MRNVMLVVLLVTGTARADEPANPPPWKRGEAETAPAGPKTFDQMTRGEREQKQREFHVDPAARRVVWSAWLCEADRSRDEARRAMAEKVAERTDAARGEMADADRNTKKARAELKTLKTTALPCSDDLVSRVAKCVGRLCRGDYEALTYAESQGGRPMRPGLFPEPIETRPAPSAPSSLPPWRRQK